MAVIHAKDFTFTYPATEESTIDGVSFDIERNEVVGLIGPLGSGKTTLCMAIAGFAPSIVGGDTSGELIVADQNRTEESGEENSGQVGMVFENFGAQIVQLKAIDEVRTPLENRGLSKQEAQEQARQLLRQVGLGEDLEDKQIWDLSGGQLQRVAIAATLAMDPQILIFDNAISQLDPQGKNKVQNIITNQVGKKTLVIVENDANFLMQIADRLLVLVDGKIVAQGKPDEILSNYELLTRADIEPPLSLRAARALGISNSPLTFEDFKRTIGPVEKHDGTLPEVGDNSHHPIARALGIREYVEGGDDKRSQTRDNFGEPIVGIEDVTFCYSDGTKALQDLSITIREGEVHALVGSSGAGKTTTIKLINGLLEPSEGKVSICGEETRGKSATDLASKVGTVFQNPDEVISERTAKDEIAFPLKQRQYERTGWFSRQKCYEDDEIEHRVAHARDLVGIGKDLFDRDPTLLPLGQRKLVTIAAALVLDPKVLLLDEPATGLGASSRHNIRQAIKQLCKQDKAVLLVSNDVDFIAEVADTVTILERGQVVLQGSLHEVFAEDNWERLSELYIEPPRTTQLARRFGMHSLSCDELISNLSSRRTEA